MSTVNEFLHLSLDELQRACLKHPDEEGKLTDAEWLAILTEEVGEVARAIQDETDAHLKTELAQVVAVAIRWARSIPQGRQRPPWATVGSVSDMMAEGTPDERSPAQGDTQ